MHHRLRHLSADIGDGKDQPRQKDADRMEAAEERNDDRGETVAGGEAEIDLPELARCFENARQARHAAADHERRPDCARGVKAAVARGVGRRADGADRKAVDRARREHPEYERQQNGDDEARRNDGSGDGVGQQLRRGEGRGLREIVSVRILPRAADQVVEHLQRDVDEHQGGEHLGHPVARPQERRDRGPGHAAHNPRRDHQQDDPEALRIGESERDARARQRADDVLALGADVPDLGLIAERQAERDDDERRRLGCDVLPFVRGDYGRDEGLIDRARPIEADQLKDDRAQSHGQEHGGDRRRDLHEAARRQPLFKPDAHAGPLSFQSSPLGRRARRP